jgi:hypothetical protein
MYTYLGRCHSRESRTICPYLKDWSVNNHHGGSSDRIESIKEAGLQITPNASNALAEALVILAV